MISLGLIVLGALLTCAQAKKIQPNSTEWLIHEMEKTISMVDKAMYLPQEADAACHAYRTDFMVELNIYLKGSAYRLLYDRYVESGENRHVMDGSAARAARHCYSKDIVYFNPVHKVSCIYDGLEDITEMLIVNFPDYSQSLVQMADDFTRRVPDIGNCLTLPIPEPKVQIEMKSNPMGDKSIHFEMRKIGDKLLGVQRVLPNVPLGLKSTRDVHITVKKDTPMRRYIASRFPARNRFSGFNKNPKVKHVSIKIKKD